MRPSEALAAHRDELRQLISRYNVTHPRVYGSVLTGKDDEESDIDLLVDATPPQPCLRLQAWSTRPRNYWECVFPC
jgi:predicted nucleotidyltransferase